MVGRLFVILLLGMSVAAIGATMLATSKRQQEFERQNLNRIADRLQGYVNLLDGNPELRERLLEVGGPSVRALLPGARLGRADTALMEVLDDRPGPVSRAHVHFTSFRSCIPKLQDLLPPPPPGHRKHPRERDPAFIPPKCRAVDVTLNDGTLLKLALDSPAVAHNGILAVDPWFLTLLVLAIAVLAYIVARMASAPLQELAAAAEDLGDDLQRDPLPLRGPREVQRAAEAFIALQHRLQRLQVARGVVASIAQRGDPGPRSVRTAADSPAAKASNRDRKADVNARRHPLVSHARQGHMYQAARRPGPVPGDLP
ncbi:hypothetical protein G6F31_013429 [Rhizopus arrhizus]|nr:hypothetical protein G6F31_013429 [Rhizopus arrhizus]